MRSDDYLHLLRSSTQHLAAHDIRLFHQRFQMQLSSSLWWVRSIDSNPWQGDGEPPGEPTVLLVNNLGSRCIPVYPDVSQCIPGDTTLEAPGVAPNKTPSVLDKSVKHLTFLFSLSCTSAGNKPDDHRGLLIRCWEKHHLSLTKYLLASSPW